MKTKGYGIEKMYLLYTFPPELHTLMTSTSLTHPRKTLFVALQIGKQETGKAKGLSAPLRILGTLLCAEWSMK
jgi:hypothetical protein